jgi:hypothetical protein
MSSEMMHPASPEWLASRNDIAGALFPVPDCNMTGM